MRRINLLLMLSAFTLSNCLGAMDRKVIEKGLNTHDRALHIKDGWIRDPYIILAPDGYYYLTGTTPLPGDPRRIDHKYNTGLGKKSIVGYKMSLWRSLDLIHWEDLDTPYSLKDGIWYQQQPERFNEVVKSNWRMWAPEVHFIEGRWIIIHTSPSPVNGANLSVTKGPKIEGPYLNPMGLGIGRRHDPSLFKDEDGTVYLLWSNTMIAPLNEDMTGFTAEPVRIDPTGSRKGPDGKPISRIGHEGATIRRIGNKYIHFGTAWSTDKMRKGTYNLYYCTADRIIGPYGPRQFAGRFLGHGTPFQDKEGRWWCTAFYNANVPPLSREQIRNKSLHDNAYTINEQGVNIVPLDVKVLKSGRIYIRAKDPDYAHPGLEEAQDFGS